MAPRRNIDRAAWETRSRREPVSERMARFERFDDRDEDRFERRSDRNYDRFERDVDDRNFYDRRERGYDRFERGYNRYDAPVDRNHVPSELDQDFAAMKRVWQMIRAGAVRMLGEVGRQY